MKKLTSIISAIFVLLATSCTNELETSMQDGKLSFSSINASMADLPTSRAHLEGGGKVVWDNGDLVGIFSDTQVTPMIFECTNINESNASFVSDNEVSGSNFFAYYPYENTTINGNTMTYTLSNYTEYKAGTYFRQCPMIAKSTTNEFGFKHTCGIIRFSITGTQRIQSLILEGNNGEIISGTGTIDFSAETPVLVIPEDATDAGKTIIMSMNNLQLSSTATDFYFVVPEVTFTQGLSLTINYLNDDSSFTPIKKSTTKSITVSRSVIKSFSAIDTDALLQGQEEEDTYAALMAFYNAMGGDNWTNNTNWGSDKPFGEWYGVYLRDVGVVDRLEFMFNNLSGQLPKEIGNLTNLRSLRLSYEPIYGTIPNELWNLTQLETLILDGLYENPNKLSGDISEKISNLTNLRQLSIMDHNITGEIPLSLATLKNLTSINLSGTCLSGNIPDIWSSMSQLESLHLGGNSLTGSIPNSMGALVNLNYLSLEGNGLTGSVPKSVMELPVWSTAWWSTLRQSPEKGGNISRDGLLIPAPKTRVKDIDGNYIDGDYFAENEYTIIFGFLENCPFSDLYIPKLVNLYHKYKDKGVEVISVSQQAAMSESAMRSYISRFGMNWDHHIIVGTEDSPMLDYEPYVVASPTVGVANKQGIIEFIPELDDRETLDDFLADKFGDTPDDDRPYESTDYSADGHVKVLQSASTGNGIDVVLMGDAYTDRLIADGTYAKDMNKAYDALFLVEPFKSFRGLFNVYTVDVVSKHEVYGVAGAETALGTWMGAFEENGSLTEVGGDHDKVFEYASKAVSSEKMNEVMVITLMNVNTYAGQCYLFDSPNEGDWGNGPSISYFPLGATDDVFAQLVHHEACGHGFAKLADEYSYSSLGEITENVIEVFQDQIAKGWLKNIDFTNDPAKIKWSHFLSDPLYAYDGLGIYEGGHQYPYGVWRPTENSIMRYNTGGFNAPSREAIYYRIHKLAYGKDWQYDYEKFVEYDAINRNTTSARSAGKPANYKPLHAPIVKRHSWKDAK